MGISFCIHSFPSLCFSFTASQSYIFGSHEASGEVKELLRVHITGIVFINAQRTIE